jgi:hypothetical protein
VKTISAPVGEAQESFAARQESCRKDIERAFGVLQARFAILTRPSQHWNLEEITEIMKCCVILHNMIIEDDKTTGRRVSISRFEYAMRRENAAAHHFQFTRSMADSDLPESFIARYSQVMKKTDHFKLKNDLIEHQYEKKRHQ